MTLNVPDRLGGWNPQLFRELKGQFKRRNLLCTVTGSLLSQFFILVAFSEQHCIKYVGSDCVQLEWNIWWQLVFRILNWLLPFLVVFSGTYLLISDLGKEENRGTLNFIRLSPQSSQSILLGKMLGVPALAHLGIALAIPLHGASALISGVPLNWLLGIYTLWGVGCYLFYSAALLMAWLNRSQGGFQSQAWAGSGIACLFGLAYIGVIDLGFDAYQSGLGLGNWQWFFLPLGRQLELTYVWMLITVSVGTYWIWQAANRLFHNPKATLLSKSQSYGLVGSFQVWLLGFFLPEYNSVVSEAQLSGGCFLLFVVNLIGFLILNSALSPHRQALQDWARYRHNSSVRQGILNRSLVQDLVWDEKSPALLAIAINLLITTFIWVPWILLLPQEVWHENFPPQQAVLGWLLTMNVILIYTALMEILVFMKKSQQTLWIVGMGGTVLILLLVSTGIQGIEMLTMPYIWLFSPLPILALAHASTSAVFLGLLAQLGVLGLLTLQLTRQLQKAGESTTKALLINQT